MKMFKGIENIVEDNIYTIKYLTEFEGDEEAEDNIKNIDNMDIDDKKDNNNNSGNEINIVN